MTPENEFQEDEMNDNGTLNGEEFEENAPEEFETNTAEDSGIEDDVDIFDPDEFEEGDPDEEFDYIDGVDLPDPEGEGEEEVSLDEFPDDDEEDE